MVKTEMPIALVIGFVGRSNGGKSTAAEATTIALRQLGHTVCEDNAGDHYRNMVKPGNTLEAVLKGPNRIDQDRIVDGQMKDILLRTMGLIEWNNKFGAKVSKNILVISARVLSYLAVNLMNEQKIPRDAYFGVGAICDIDTILSRAVAKNIKLGKYSRDQLRQGDMFLLDIERVRVGGRDEGDLMAFSDLYGVNSIDELVAVPPNNIQIDSGRMTPQREVEMVLNGLGQLGL